MSPWALFKSDLRRYQDLGGWPPGNKLRLVAFCIRTQGVWANADFRFGHWVREDGPAWLKPVSVLWHLLIEISTGISVSPQASIGPGFYIGHFGGIIVGTNVTIGCECVYIGPGAKVFGPIHVGSNSMIGANAVVNRTVPEWVVVAGVPARVVKSIDPT